MCRCAGYSAVPLSPPVDSGRAAAGNLASGGPSVVRFVYGKVHVDGVIEEVQLLIACRRQSRCLGHFQVGQNPSDDCGIDECDQPFHRSAADGAYQDLDGEHAPQQLCPSEGSALRTGPRCGLTRSLAGLVVGRGSVAQLVCHAAELDLGADGGWRHRCGWEPVP